jgi:hypothetical protein
MMHDTSETDGWLLGGFLHRGLEGRGGFGCVDLAVSD